MYLEASFVPTRPAYAKERRRPFCARLSLTPPAFLDKTAALAFSHARPSLLLFRTRGQMRRPPE